MSRELRRGRSSAVEASDGAARGGNVGKRTRVEAVEPVQRRPAQGQGQDPDAVQAAAARGTSGAAGPLPHLERIQQLFGRHDVRAVRAYVGGSAAEGAAAMGAPAFATGDQVAFASPPDLHTAAHEAAHVVQQRSGVQVPGGVGQAGDPHERHANEVADQVVAGRSAEALLDRIAGGGGGGGRAIQRYTIENGHRISENRELAMVDAAEPKTFFARPAAIERSNAILAALQSKVKLVLGGAAPVVGMQTVTPVNRDETKPVFDCNECIEVADRVTNSGQSHAIYQPDGGGKEVRRQSPYDIPSLNKLVDVLTHTPDVTPQDVVTGQQQLEGDEDAEPLEFRYGDIAVSGTAGAANNQLKAKIPNRNLRIALLLETFKNQYEQMPEVQQGIMDHLAPLFEIITIKATEEKDEQEVEGWVNVIKEAIGDLERSKSGAYRDLDPGQRSAQAARLGVNEHARPEVGESYGVLGTRARTKQDGDKWSFHFAAVIARDAGDSVTLENYNRMKGEDGNPEWYFDLQGPRAQSFHDKHKDTVADGVTLRLGVPATPEQREAVLVDLARMKIDPGPLRPRILQAETRADLAALYADALETPSGIFWRIISKLITRTGGDRDQLRHVLGVLTVEQRVDLAVIYNGDLERGDQALGTEWRPSKALKQQTIDLVIELARPSIGPNPDDWGGEGPGPNGGWGRNHPLGQDPHRDVF